MRSFLSILFSLVALTTFGRITVDEDTSTSEVQNASAQSLAMQETSTSEAQGESFSAYDRYRLLGLPTFFHSVAGHHLQVAPHVGESNSADAVDDALLQLYLNHPELVESSENSLRSAGAVGEDISAPLIQENPLAGHADVTPQESIDAPVDVVVEKPRFWTYKGDYYLQFLQNYISGNWYKGGESNYSMVGSATMEANYDNKGKWKWDNKLEMKLGFQTSRSDSVHSMKASEDLLRFTSKVGLQATHHWYYTLNFLAYTQFMRGYKNNDFFTYSDFLSPLNVNVSLGMDYSVEWLKKRLTGHIQLSPLAYNFRYVDRLALSTRNGLKAGHHTLHDFGSMVTVDLLWKFTENISWKTRLYGFTTYSRTELEWENEFTFKFNRYISSKLFLYPRFDDATTRDGHHGYWQFKEYFSLGFSYTF